MEADPPGLGAELVLLALVALSVAAVVAAMLARRQLFLGSFDSEQIFGQGHALLQAWASGTSISTRAFLDLPLPLTYSPLEHAFSMPLLALSRLTNPWFAFNLMALCTLFANGLSMYGLLRVGGLCRPAAAVGGFLFFTAPTLLVHTYQDAYLGQAFYINIMFALQLRDRRAGFRAAHWGLLGACAALLAGAHEYLGLMGLGLLAVFLFCSARRLGARRLAVAVAASMFVFVVVEAPVLWMYAEQRAFDRENHVEFARPIEHSVVNSCLPRDYLFPRTYHPMLDWRGLAQESSQTGESAPYLGFINLSALLLLGMWALWRRDRVRAWLDASPLMTTLRCELLLCGVGGFLLTLGPRWRTAPWIPLPVELLLRPMCMGRRVGMVNIDYRPRIGESTMRPLESAVWTMKRIWRARFT
ncbi:MAG: hypothetical protein EB084_12555 [Proteobacteria bacterium]|nr:hypothetical protein [Pseudomonadota bacterium]